jgi:plastocyanin
MIENRWPKSPHRAGKSALVVLVALLACTLAACGSTASPNKTATSGGSVAGSVIVIQNFAFSPGRLTVKPGETVTVTNKDSVTHTLTSESGLFNTGNVPAHSSMHFTAPTKPGTYQYRCSIHQFMTGTIVVSSS